MRQADAGALVVAAFGQILRDDVLGGWPCVNVHYSLLPAYRGAAPALSGLAGVVADRFARSRVLAASAALMAHHLFVIPKTVSADSASMVHSRAC